MASSYLRYSDPDDEHPIFKNLKEIEFDTDRDNFMSAKEAIKYGLIDSMLNERSIDI